MVFGKKSGSWFRKGKEEQQPALGVDEPNPAVPGIEENRQTPSPNQYNGRISLTNIDESARYASMVRYMFGRVSASQWLAPPGTSTFQSSGVLLRRSRGNYVHAPETISEELLAAVRRINAEVAFTMSTETVSVILSALDPYQTEQAMPDGSQLQIVDSLMDIASSNVKKFQYACLVRKECMLLIWHDDLQMIMPHAARLEEKLLTLVWGGQGVPFASSFPGTGSNTARDTPNGSILNYSLEKKLPQVDIEEMDPLDEEKGLSSPESLGRPINLTSAFFVGLGVCLIIFLLLGLATSNLILECLTDGNWIRLAFVLLIPLLSLVGLFFVVVIFTDIFQAFGPISGVKSNSRYFSAIKPSLRRAYAEGFTPPHVTIQMPVYKEGLQAVIIPTVNSLKAAISHYESHGGSASIFVNEDGLRAGMPEEDVQARLDFYQDNNIGWVSRPKHGDDGFVRAGKFKKASNMNFALNISQKVEAYLQEMVDDKIARDGTDYLDEQEEEQMYKVCLERVLQENPLARASGNIRVGEVILIVDSDTRVPVNCLLYGAAEMFLSPEVAIVQHSTGVMQVVGDFFENGITFFTNLVYSSIRFSIGCGEVAPFVGHNAFLRWQAVQSVGVAQEEGYVAYWSESHVSEDFDIALRLQIAGSTVRVAAYHDNQFKEGVSLTIYDELTRWQKYAYGCSELVFNPFHRWIFRGPFTKLFYTFLWSDMILSSKCTILAYIASYFALASGGPLTTMNYILIGWFNGQLDKFYMESWKIFVALVVVFNLAGNVCLAILRYRLGEKGLLAALLENFKWMPMITIFFGGLSFHLNCAILSHLFHIDMQWGATSKEAVKSNFFQEVPKIFKSFKYMYITLTIIVAAMIYFGCFAPRGWEIQGATAIVPLAVTLISHAVLPFLLNPSLMVFNY